MPSVSSLVVNDRENTPVAHTFVPNRQDPTTGVWSFTEMVGGVPIGVRRVALSIRTNKDGGKRARLSVTWPTVVTEVINGVSRSVVDRTNFASAEFTFAKTSVTQERKNVIGIMANLLLASQTMVNAMLVDLEELY